MQVIYPTINRRFGRILWNIYPFIYPPGNWFTIRSAIKFISKIRAARRWRRCGFGTLTTTMKHPGFAKVQSKIENEGYSKKIAGKILAARARQASNSAKQKNPNLKRVK